MLPDPPSGFSIASSREKNEAKLYTDNITQTLVEVSMHQAKSRGRGFEKSSDQRALV